MDPPLTTSYDKKSYKKRAHNQARPTIQKGQICQSHHHHTLNPLSPTDDLSKGRWDKLQRVWHSSDELSGRVLWGRHDDETDTDANVLAVGTPALTRG